MNYFSYPAEWNLNVPTARNGMFEALGVPFTHSVSADHDVLHAYFEMPHYTL